MTIAENMEEAFPYPVIDSSTICVQADVPLRHQLMATAFGIERPHEFEDWYQQNNQHLGAILEAQYKKPVTMIDARQVRQDVHRNITQFKKHSFYQERMPFIISLDPVIAGQGQADYVYQESRVSLVDVNKPFIDLEHNARDYVNRFVDKVSVHNGAGKSLTRQMAEIKRIVTAHQLQAPIDVALVDGYANSGKSIIGTFGNRDIRGLEYNGLSVILGALNSLGAENFREAGFSTHSVMRFNSSPAKCIDQTDMIPTLGGRAIGWRMPGIEQVGVPTRAFSVGRFAVNVAVAVDAVTGNYPWQVDITDEEMTPGFRRELFAYATTTAHEFWTSLEKARGAEIQWGDLAALNGIARVFYPARDKQDLNDLRYPLASGPVEAIERIIKDEVYA